MNKTISFFWITFLLFISLGVSTSEINIFTLAEQGDLDGDGDLDAFISGYGGGPSEIWFNE